MYPAAVHSRLTAAKARAMAKAAEELKAEAYRLARRAETLEQLADHQSHMAQIPKALRQVRGAIDRGETEADAIAGAATIFGFRADTLALYWREHVQASQAGRKWRRDREVMRLAWAGKTNAEIGALVGLRPKSVSRIVSQRLGRKPAYEPARFRPIKPVHAGLTPARYFPRPETERESTKSP